MASDERKVQLGVTVDATEARKGFSDVKDSARDMAQSVAAQGAAAGSAIDSIGSGGSASAQKVDAATRSMIQSIQRTTAAMEAGSKSSSDYYQALAQQRGIPTDALAPYLAQLDAAKAKQDAAAQSMAGVEVAAQKFMQTLQGQAQALKDEAATFGMSRTELLAYQAAKLGISDAATPIIAQISREEAALKALRDSTLSAATAVNAFGETEAEASARISDMVTRSREAQVAMNATAASASSSAAGLSTFNASSEQVRSTIAAQTSAMQATAREMASVNEQMDIFRATAAQGTTSFQTLYAQFDRLDLLMAKGKVTMEQYDAATAALWKDEERLQQQVSALVGRYDPLNAATQKLASSQSLLEDAYKNGQVSAEQYSKALSGIQADKAAIQLQQLTQQEAQLEKALKSGQLSMSDYKKSLSDINASKSGLKEIVASANDGASAMDGFGAHTKAARTEVVRLLNDIANGNFGRFEQSAVVLAEQMDALRLVLNPIALSIAAIGAAAYATYSIIESSNARVLAFNNAMNATSGYAGQTRDSIQQLAEALSSRFGMSVGTAIDDLNKMVATGKISGDLFKDVANVAAAMAQSTGESFDKVLDGLLKQQDGVSKAAQEYQAAHHTMTDAQLALMEQLEKTGQKHTAFAMLIKQEEDDIARTTRAKTSLMAGYWNDVKDAWDRYTRSLAGNSTEVDKLNDLKARQAAQQSGKTANYDYTDYGPLIDAQQKIIDKINADQAASEKDRATKAQLADSQAEVTKQIERTLTPQEKLTEAIKNDNAIINNRISLLKATGQYTDAQAASLEKLRQRMIETDTQSITPAKKARSSAAGAIDKTQLQGDLQAVKDSLDQELSYVKNAQTQLDALYKSGGIAEATYYQQTRDNLAKTATAKIDAYNQDVALLQKSLSDRNLSAQQRAQISSQIQHDQALAAQATEEFFNAVGDSAAKADKAWQDYGQSQLNALDKQIATLSQQDQALKDQIATFGMTKSAIDDLAVARTQDQLAAEEQGLAMARLNGLAPEVIKNYEDEIDRLKQVLKLRQAIASDQGTLDQLTEEKKVADQAVQDWKSAANSIESGITNALMNGFNNGKSFGQQLADSLKSLFKTLVLQPIIAPIAGSMASMMYPGAAQAYAQTNPNSPLAGNPLGSLLSYNNLSGAYNTAAGWLGMGGSSVAGSAIASAGTSALTAGGATLGGLGGAIGGDVAGSTAGMVGGNAFGFTAGAAGDGLGLAGTLGSSAGLWLGGAGALGGLAGGAIFGNKGYSSIGGSLGAMGGMALGASTAFAGTALGAELGSFAGPIGAVAGMVLGAALGSLFGGGETRYGAMYDSTPGGVINKLTGPSGGDPAASTVQQQIASTYTQMQQLATAMGGSVTGLGDYRAGYEISPSKGNSWVQTGFGADNYIRTDLKGTKDSQTVLNDFSLALQQSVIKGLQQASLDKPYAGVLQGVDSTKLSAADVTNLLNELNSLKSLFDVIKTMGSDFDNLKNASTDAQLAVMNLSGGVSQFSTNAVYFEQHFVPAAEQTANQAKAVTDQLAALGMSSVKTNDQFRAAVEGIDLSTAAGQQLYVQMLQLAPAFDQMTQAAKAAADAQQSLWNGYFSAIYTSDQQAAMSQAQLQAKFDALGVAMPKTNADFQALVENMDTSTQPMKDLQNALLALAPTFAQVTQAVQQAQANIGAAQKTAISSLSSSAQGLLTDGTNASSLLDAINSTITGNSSDTSGQVSALWSELTGGGVSLTQQIDLATKLNDLITKRYQAEQQAVSTLTQQSKQLLDYVQGLKAGNLSTETPSQKLADAAQQYADTLAKAQGGDQTAIGNLSTAADNYLKLAQTYYASSDTYSQIFASVTSQLGAFGNALQSLGQSSDRLSQQSLDQLTQLRNIVAGQVSSADAQYQGVVSQLAQQLTALDAIQQAAGVQSSVPSILQGLPSEIAAQLASIIGTGAATGGDQITSMYQSVLGRTPTANEVSYWTDSFANGSKTIADFKYSADQELIGNLYQQVLGRQADAGGLQFYTDKLYNGKETLDQIKSDLQNSLLNGSHAGGADYIPFDGYRAELHKGEAVITSANNQKLSQLLSVDWSQYGRGNNEALIAEVKALNARIGQLEGALVQATTASATAIVAATGASAKTISDGAQAAADVGLRTERAKPALR